MTSGRFIDFMGQGLAADRAATPDVYPLALVLYWSQDTQELSLYDFDAAAWIEDILSGGDPLALAPEWAPNFTDDGDLYIPAVEAMTIDQGNAEIGTGTITFEKSTNAAPGTFSSTSLPAALEAGAWLKVSAASVTGFVATHLVRTA